MEGQRLLILVVDDDPDVIADYRSILCPTKTRRAPDFAGFSRIEDIIFLAALAHDAFPEIDLHVVGRSEDAVEAVHRALEENRPFTAAFVGAELRGDDRGLEAAEDIRALDRDMPIVLVTARCGMHPVDVCARIPPADRVFILAKPFHAAEIQQLALNLAARRSAEQAARAGAVLWRGLSRALSEIPAGLAKYDEGGRLIYANRWMKAALGDTGEPHPSGALSPGHDGEPWPDLPRTRLPVDDGMVAETLRAGPERTRASMIVFHDGRRVLELEARVPGGDCRLYVDVTSLAEPDPAAVRRTRHARTVPRIPLRQADSGRPAVRFAADPARPQASGAVAAGDGAIERCVVAAVERVRADISTAGSATVEVVAPVGIWPARIDGDVIETALERLLGSVAEATPPGGRIGVELANVPAGSPQGRRQVGRDAGDHVRISVHFVVASAPASAAADGRVPSAASFARLGEGLDEVQAVAARAGGYVHLELAAGSRAVVAIYLPRHRDDGTDQASNRANPAGPAGPRPTRDRGPPLGKDRAD